MLSEQMLNTLMNQKGNYSFEVIRMERTEPAINRCSYAELYAQWVNEAVKDITKNTAVTRLREVLLLGTLKHFELKSLIPKDHLESAKHDDHVCLYDAFEQLYQWLETLALLQPAHAKLMLPQPPPPSPPPSPPPRPIVQLSASPMTMGILSNDVVEEQQELEGVMKELARQQQ